MKKNNRFTLKVALPWLMVLILSSVAQADEVILVKDVLPGSNSSIPEAFVTFKNELFFIANDGLHGRELWKSDGSTAGTVLVKDIHAGSDYKGGFSSAISHFMAVDDLLFFSARNELSGQELWKSDGTAAGTVLVKDIAPGGLFSNPTEFVAMNGLLYFVARDGDEHYGLWQSDGTATGTVPIKIFASKPNNLVAANGLLFFQGNDGINGRALWKSDGSSTGTVLVKDIRPASVIRELVVANELVFFIGDDDIHGRELWKSDGTTSGTVMVKDINPGSATSAPRNLTEVNGQLFFAANSELWKSDGSEQGTVQVTDFLASPFFLTDMNGLLYFYATDDLHGAELWKSDGSNSGTVLVKDIRAGSLGSNSILSMGTKNLTAINTLLYFTISEGQSGIEVWRSDGTEAGTVRVKSVLSLDNRLATQFIAVNDVTYFSGSDNSHGQELWKIVGVGDAIVDSTDNVENPLPPIDRDNAIALQPDFGFAIPALQYIDDNGVKHFFKTEFSFTPSNSRLLFEAASITEILILDDGSLAEKVPLTEHIRIGAAAYDRSFGRGCDSCHGISFNPQLVELIAAGSLDKTTFSEIVINGRNGMPKSGDAIMAVTPVEEAGYSLEQAIDAIYRYLVNRGNGEIISDTAVTQIPAAGNEENAIILNQDFSFNIPVLKYVDAENINHYFNVDFVFLTMDNKFLFEPIKITAIE